MKKQAIIAFLLFVNIIVSAQKNTKSNAEWDELDKTFIAFIKALETNNQAVFRTMTLTQVDCIDCIGKPEFNEQGYFVTPDIFYLNIAKNFSASPVYKALAKRGYTFSTIVLKDFKPAFLPKDYPTDLKLYEVWVPTYLKNELSKGHQGTSHAFQFVKINGKFKFYGLTSIP